MKFSFGLNLSAVLVLAACAHQPMQKPDAAPVPTAVDNHAPEQGTGLTEQKLIRAKHYMAASANPLATEAGYEVLKRGGSAIGFQTTFLRYAVRGRLKRGVCVVVGFGLKGCVPHSNAFYEDALKRGKISFYRCSTDFAFAVSGEGGLLRRGFIFCLRRQGGCVRRCRARPKGS